MREIAELKSHAAALLSSNQVQCIIGWKAGDFPHLREVALFTCPQQLDALVYDAYCTVRLSRQLIWANQQYEKTAIFLTPEDAFSYNQLLKEKQVFQEKTVVIPVDAFPADKPEHPHTMESIGSLPTAERQAFWEAALAPCVRCNACRNICPVCNCKACVFDSPAYGVGRKANIACFDGDMFHITRALHVAGRCTACGECSRACPNGVPLYLLNQKVLAEVLENYGDYRTNEAIALPTDAPAFTALPKNPLLDFDLQND